VVVVVRKQKTASYPYPPRIKTDRLEPTVFKMIALKPTT
jgi:hypothetical protein